MQGPQKDEVVSGQDVYSPPSREKQVLCIIPRAAFIPAWWSELMVQFKELTGRGRYSQHSGVESVTKSYRLMSWSLAL